MLEDFFLSDGLNSAFNTSLEAMIHYMGNDAIPENSLRSWVSCLSFMMNQDTYGLIVQHLTNSEHFDISVSDQKEWYDPRHENLEIQDVTEKAAYALCLNALMLKFPYKIARFKGRGMHIDLEILPENGVRYENIEVSGTRYDKEIFPRIKEKKSQYERSPVQSPGWVSIACFETVQNRLHRMEGQ